MIGGKLLFNDIKSSQPYERWGGIDALRLAAAACVFLHHALTMAGLDVHIVYGMRIGRFGTTTFFAIAGLLAASTRRSPGDWLWQRIRFIYPPFWIALAIYFVLVGLTGHKTFDAWQAVCQFSGIGYFTHPGRLVNVPTWFLSVILALYLVAYVAKRTFEPAVILLMLMAVPYFAYQLSGDALNTACAASLFFVGYTLPFFGRRAPTAGLLWVLILAGSAWSCVELRYGVVAILFLSIAICWPANPAVLQKMAGYSYAWFLMHGLSLHAAKLVVGERLWPLVVVGGVASFMAAVALRAVSDRIVALLFPNGLHGSNAAMLRTTTVNGLAAIATCRNQSNVLSDQKLSDGPRRRSVSESRFRPDVSGEYPRDVDGTIHSAAKSG